jgi:FecR-like protein
MRKAFRLPALFISIALVLCCSIVGSAQNREKYVISAKAGGINAITGQASVHSKGESDWQQLSITDDLNAGDRVRTDYDGRVEILLNPGSYLRVGGDSEVELSDNTLSNLELRLLRGTAIVEATGANDLELNINISTPHTKLSIVKQGLYRLNVVPGDATELIVRKGRVILSDTHTKVKGGNKVVFSATNVTVAKLTKEEKKQQEEVDLWSKSRAQELAKANQRITDRMLNSAFATFSGFYDPFARHSLGLWFYNSRWGCYTFLPFYYGWGSPYGSSYSTSIYNPYIPQYYYPRGNAWPNNSGNSGSGGYPGGGSSGGSVSRQPSPPPTPPQTGTFGDGGGRRERMIDPDTGNRLPRKNLEPSRPN